METQNKIILEWLQAGNTITQWQAAMHWGCWRLGARIFDLRSKGHNIETIWQQKKKKRYALYKLIK